MSSPFSNIQIVNVKKPVTAAPLFLYAQSSGSSDTLLPIGQYSESETNPSYRLMKVSQVNQAMRIMFRRASQVITSVSDWIPLDSKIAVIMMLKAVRFYKEDHYDAAAAAEAVALKFLTEDDKSRQDSAANIGGTEIQSARNISIRDNSILIAADVYDDACSIFGPIGQNKIFDKITDAIDILGKKSHWDTRLAHVDLATNNASYFTLPRYVDIPLEINVNGRPGNARSKWFEYNLNGVGGEEFTRWSGWDDMGPTNLVNSLPDGGCKIVAIPDNSADNGCLITVWGMDANGNSINGSNGFTVPCVQGSNTPNATAPATLYITRITKAPSVGFVSLYALNSDGSLGVLLGYYWPDETEPMYSRIRISTKATNIRILYRTKQQKINTIFDPLNIGSRLAVVDMLRAISSKDTNLQASAAYELSALSYLMDDQNIRNPHKTPTINVNDPIYMSEQVPFA